MIFDELLYMSILKNISVIDIDASGAPLFARGESQQGAPTFVMQDWLLGICTQGEAEFMINQSRRSIRKNAILSVLGHTTDVPLPELKVSLIAASADFEMSAIIIPAELSAHVPTQFSNKYIKERLLQNVNITQFYNLLKSGGAYLQERLVPDETVKEVLALFEMVRRRTDHDSDISGRNLGLLLMLIESVVMILLEASPIGDVSSVTMNRQDILTKNFFADLMVHCREHHDVNYYAANACVSPKYLSTVIREQTGMPALQWINLVVVLNAKQLLKSTSSSVAQVADELHFSSASSFIRFFRQQTQTTPQQFRKETGA